MNISLITLNPMSMKSNGYIVFSIFCVFSTTTVFSQMKIGSNPSTINAASLLELESNTKGFLLPRLNTMQQNAIASPPMGLMIYNTDSSCQCWYNGSAWKSLCNPQNGNFWKLSGNAGTSPATHFLGTTDNQSFVFKTNNAEGMRLDSTGNLGIGTTTPASKLEVNGAFNMYKDSMRIFQSDDILPAVIPGIQFVGAKAYNFGVGKYINGIYHLPSMAGNTMGAAGGYLDDANPNQQSLFSADSMGANIRYSAATNIAAAFSADASGANVNAYNGSTNTSGSILLNDSNFVVNLNSSVNQYSNIDMQRLKYDLHINNDAMNRNYGEYKTDTTYSFGIRDNASSINSGFMFRKDNMNMNFFAPNLSSGLNIDSTFSYGVSNSSKMKGSYFLVNDSAVTLTSSYSQQVYMGIGTFNPTHALHVYAATNPARLEGLQSGDITDSLVSVDNNGVLRKIDVSRSAWSLNGNAGTIDNTHFIGTTDNVAINFRVNNQVAGRIDPSTNNVFYGMNAGGSNVNGNTNLAIGQGALSANNTGTGNTALGYNSLVTNQTGINNMAIGYNADVTADGLTNATAIGYNAKVSQNNSLVLGGIKADVVNVGIGTDIPNSTLHVQGSLSMNIRTVTADDKVNNDDYTIINRAVMAITLTLPDPTTCAGRIYRLLNYGTNKIVFNYKIFSDAATASDTLEPKFPAVGGFVFGNKITIQSDGTDWVCLGVQ